MSNPAGSERLHQITESDLADLERLLPDICWAVIDKLDPSLRTKFRRAQTILSNVRWRYGPPENVQRIDP